MNLILFDPHEVRDGGAVTVTGARAGHLRQVLRVAVGDEVRVGLVEGGVGTGTVVAVEDERVELRCRVEASAPARPAVDLLLALPRPKVMRRLWAQLAAVGVGQVVLTNAARVERQYFDTHLLTEATYRPLLIEGLQQARDTRVPRVVIHRQFKILVEDELDGLFGQGARLVAHPLVAHPLVGHPRARQSIAAILREQASPDTERRALLAIGPEGGWNDFELDLLRAHGFQPVEMGPRTLRTDTACIALLALLHDALRA